MTDAFTPEQKQRWRGFKYQPVPGLANRHISRYLRGQRRNMLRFFTERGLLDLTERMYQIRKSRQGMLAKNRMFQEVLNEYVGQVSPRVGATTPERDGSQETPPIETAPGVPAQSLVVLPETVLAGESSGDGNNNDGGVPAVASADGADELVIEE